MTESEWLSSADPAAMLRYLNHDPGDRPDRSIYDCSSLKIGDRQLRLFACACCRAVWDQLTDSQQVKIVFAEQEPWHQSALGSVHSVYLSQDAITEYARTIGADRCINYAIGWLDASIAAEVASQAPAWLQMLVDLPSQVALLRDIIGNPFRSARLPFVGSAGSVWYIPGDPIRLHADAVCPQLQWNGGCIPTLAQVMYDARDFTQMPLLADMLEDAGCTEPEIINHCRGLQRCSACLGEGVVYYGGIPPYGYCGRCSSSGWVPQTGPHVRGCWVLDLLLRKE